MNNVFKVAFLFNNCEQILFFEQIIWEIGICSYLCTGICPLRDNSGRG